ncbi:MAG: hypothetical protein E7665_02405 [Ruminococcaceae bacterium]|nr:hypothetical protein [Oscillospiraceae bacterium]
MTLKKTLLILIAAVMCISILSGCTTDASKSGSTEENSKTSDTPSDNESSEKVGTSDESSVSSTESKEFFTGKTGTDDMLVYITRDNKLIAAEARENGNKVILAESLYSSGLYQGDTEIRAWIGYPETNYCAFTYCSEGNYAYFYSNATASSYDDGSFYEGFADLHYIDLSKVKSDLSNLKESIVDVAKQVRTKCITASPYGLVYTDDKGINFFDGKKNVVLSAGKIFTPKEDIYTDIELFMGGRAAIAALSTSDENMCSLEIYMLDGSGKKKTLAESMTYEMFKDMAFDYNNDFIVFTYISGTSNKEFKVARGTMEEGTMPLPLKEAVPLTNKKDRISLYTDIHNDTFYYRTSSYTVENGNNEEVWFYDGEKAVFASYDSNYLNAEEGCIFIRDGKKIILDFIDGDDKDQTLAYPCEFTVNSRTYAFDDRGILDKDTEFEKAEEIFKNELIALQNEAEKSDPKKNYYYSYSISKELKAAAIQRYISGTLQDVVIRTDKGDTKIQKFNEIGLYADGLIAGFVYNPKNIPGRAYGASIDLVVTKDGKESKVEIGDNSNDGYGDRHPVPHFARISDNNFLYLHKNTLNIFGGESIKIADNVNWVYSPSQIDITNTVTDGTLFD